MARRTADWDIIIVGAGSAGLPCAIRAAERGAKVLQLDADYRVGGTLYWSSGQISAAGTRLQRELGIEDSPDEHFRDAQRIARDSIDPVVLRLMVDHAPATADWLMELGMELAPGMPTAGEAHEAYSTRRYFWGPRKGLSILDVLKPVHDDLVARGLVDLRLQHRVEGLLTNSRGAVVGVSASTPNGRFEFRGRRVILASGGYAANPELWAQLTPELPLCSHGNPYARGDGLQAALALGAQADGGDKFLCTFAGFLEDPADPCTGNFLILSPGYRKVWEIFVDAQGQRFMQEDHPSIDYRERALFAQPKMAMNIVLDEAILQNAAPLTLEAREAYVRRFGRHPAFVSAQTLPALARRLGIPARALQATIADYNRAVDQAQDPACGKQFLIRRIEKPPFHAIRAQGITVFSPAGVKVDERLRVLGRKDRPIQGLYAAGEILGAGRTTGNAFVGGLSLMPALTFGRLLGERVEEL